MGEVKLIWPQALDVRVTAEDIAASRGSELVNDRSVSAIGLAVRRLLPQVSTIWAGLYTVQVWPRDVAGDIQEGAVYNTTPEAKTFMRLDWDGERAELRPQTFRFLLWRLTNDEWDHGPLYAWCAGMPLEPPVEAR